MCVGMPMQIIDCDDQYAICLNQGEQQKIDIRLVGRQAPSTWILVFLGAAREVMSESEARNVLDALTAMQKIMSGDSNIDELFSDLIEREPRLPDHLKGLVKQSTNTSLSKK